jgi:hypothetical protein
LFGHLLEAAAGAWRIVAIYNANPLLITTPQFTTASKIPQKPINSFPPLIAT